MGRGEGGVGRGLSRWAGGAGVAPREGLWSALAWAPDPKAGSGFCAGPDLALCLEAGGVLAAPGPVGPALPVRCLLLRGSSPAPGATACRTLCSAPTVALATTAGS